MVSQRYSAALSATVCTAARRSGAPQDSDRGSTGFADTEEIRFELQDLAQRHSAALSATAQRSRTTQDEETKKRAIWLPDQRGTLLAPQDSER